MATGPASQQSSRNRHFPRFEKYEPRCPIHACLMKEVVLPMPRFACVGDSEFMTLWRAQRKAFRCPRRGCPRIECAEHANLISANFRSTHKLTNLEY